MPTMPTMPETPQRGSFVRFVCAQPHPTVDAELGMFSARDTIDFTVLRGSVQRAHDEAWYWFARGTNAGLYRPRLHGRARTSDVRRSLFWFKADAAFFGHDRGSVVRRARQLAEVLTAAGCEIRELHTDDPGTIVWQDLDQVLARPVGHVSRAFPRPQPDESAG